MNVNEIYKYREAFSNKIDVKLKLLLNIDLNDNINLPEVLTDMISNENPNNKLKSLLSYKNTNILIKDQCAHVNYSKCFHFNRNFLDNLYVANKLLLYKVKTKYKILDIYPDYLKLNFSHLFGTAANFKNENIKYDSIETITNNEKIFINSYLKNKYDLITIMPLFSKARYEDIKDLEVYYTNVFIILTNISNFINPKNNKIIFIVGGLSYAPHIIKLCEVLLINKIIKYYKLHINEEPIVYNFNRDLMYIELSDFNSSEYNEKNTKKLIKSILTHQFRKIKKIVEFDDFFYFYK